MNWKNGDILNNKYKINKKIGSGKTSIVVLATNIEVCDNDPNKQVAIKISNSDAINIITDEIHILNITKSVGITGGIVELLDSFEIEINNLEPIKYICIVLKLLGNELFAWSNRYYNRGLPISFVKKITTDILHTLVQFHCYFIHTDLKPENIFLSTNVKITTTPGKKLLRKYSDNTIAFYEEDIDILEKVNAYIGDLGFAKSIETTFIQKTGTRIFMSPECIIGCDVTTSTDIWSLGCIIFELITGDPLFDTELSKYKNMKSISRNECQIAMIIELLGDIPNDLTNYYMNGINAKNIFNLHEITSCKLNKIKKFKYTPLDKILHNKYNFTIEDSKNISNFILKMINWNPKKRINALEALQNFWLAEPNKIYNELPTPL